ncbi:MAG: cyclic nucleotide-binding domain-containing protein [Cyclobacteriaceae bacterium]
MKNLKEILSELSFFSAMSEEMLEFIAGCGQNMHFAPNEYVGKENESADYLFVIRKGNIAVQLAHPTKGALTLRSLHDGEIAGFSWIIPPYRMQFDLLAREHTSVVALDGNCVRKKCEQDHHLGYLMMKESATIMNKRLEDTRMQLMDVYRGRI